MYNVGMKNIQYTVRDIPKPVDKAMRQLAKEKGKSLNQTIVDALQQVTGTTTQVSNTSFDWLIGKGKPGKGFDEAQDWLESLPKDIGEL